MKVVFVYYNPHPIHKAWADSVTNIQVPFISKKIFDIKNLSKKSDKLAYKLFNFLRKSPSILQPLSISQALRIPRADVYLLENPACLPPVLFRKKKNSKIIMINDDIFFYLLRDSKGILRKIYQKYLRYIDGVISSSNMIRNVSREFINVPNLVNHAFVDTRKFSRFKVDTKSANICFTGMLANQKRIDLVIKAFLRVNKKYQNKLYLIGAEEDNIPILTKNRKNGGIIITGWTKNPEKYMKKCGIYINPAEREAFGMNIIEAMCMGIPPLVSKKCGAAEIVSKVSKKLIIKQEVGDIVKKIEWLNSNINNKKRLGKKCRIMAMKYTKERSSAEFKKKFYRLLDQIR